MVRHQVGPKVQIFAALKADGYGFATLPMARAALDGGVDALSMLDCAEAIDLRSAGIEAPILLYAGAPIDADAVAIAARQRLILTVLSEQQIDMVALHARAPVSLAIKLEVGAERLGVLPEILVPMATRIAREPFLQLAIANAHPTFRDDAPDTVLREQFHRFTAALELLSQAGLQMPMRLFASSKALGRMSGLELDAVDPGQFLYGDATDRPIIHSLTSRLLQIRSLTRDFDIEHAPFDMSGIRRIGVIPFGKVDGSGRCHGPDVLVRGRRARILGGPGLEYMRIDLSHLPEAQEDDEVVLIGGQTDAAGNSAEIPLSEICAALGATPSDIAMTIGPRVVRTWFSKETCHA